MPLTLTGALIMVSVVVSVIASISIYLAFLAYFETRRVRQLLEAVISVGRLREISRIRRELSRKPSRRYIVFAVIAEHDISERALNQALLRAARRLLGSSFIAESGFQLVYFNPITRKGVVRVRSNYKNQALAVLGAVRETNGTRVILLPRHTTGTIRKAKELADST